MSLLLCGRDSAATNNTARSQLNVNERLSGRAQRQLRPARARLLAYLVLIAGPLMVSAAPGVSAGASQQGDATDDAARSVVWLMSRAASSTFVPDAEAFLLSRINQCRMARGVAPLASNAALRSAARRHSYSMAIKGFVGHGSPSGQSFFERATALVPPGTPVAENVVIAQTPLQAHRALLASREHLNNILASGFHSVGIGVATAGTLGLAVTEMFVR